MRSTKPTRSAGAVVLLALLCLTAPVATQPLPGGDGVCVLPADPGPCDGVCPRWFFEHDTLLCEEFIWGCCGGNANNFESRLACQASCACALPMDIGPCDGECPRWFFNSATGQCEQFMWGCCGGNANNFETLEACEAACANPCLGDVTFDGFVDVADLLGVLAGWGAPGGAADVNGDGIVDVGDLLVVLGQWGECR